MNIIKAKYQNLSVERTVAIFLTVIASLFGLRLGYLAIAANEPLVATSISSQLSQGNTSKVPNDRRTALELNTSRFSENLPSSTSITGNEVGIVSLYVSEANLAVGETTRVSVVVSDRNGRPMSGELVIFFGSLGTISPDNAVTNAQGEALAEYIAGNHPGKATIQALAGSANGPATIQIIALNVLAVTSVIPSAGKPGDVVTITGTYFASGVKAYFGDKECVNLAYISTVKLQCIVPNVPSGSLNIKIVNPNGDQAELKNAFKNTANSSLGDIYLPLINSSSEVK